MRTFTEQETFWSGEFGTEYSARNSLDTLLGPCIAMWATILRHCPQPPASAFEMGCNIGANLHALKTLLPALSLSAVEINSHAAERARKSTAEVHNCSILDFEHQPAAYDLVFSCGVLIHCAPESLPAIYRKLHALSRNYLLISEYYNPTPVSISYRNHQNKLFKRDFAGELLDMFPDLELLAYRFIYHRDPVFPRDDCTWFLFRKSAPRDADADR